MTATRPRCHIAFRFLILAVMAAAMVVSAGALRADAGSESPTPYTVDRTGITLPTGQAFPDNGHVNIRWNGGSAGLHFESKCITRTDAECAGARHEAAQYIGARFIPWTAFGVPADACIEWVQIAQYQEHYGEGGQSPVCLTEEEPCPTETPTTPGLTPSPSESAEPSPEPTPSTPTPTGPTSTPEPTATGPASPSPLPSDPEPSDSPTSPVTSPTPGNTDPTPTSPALDESTTTPTYRAELSAVDDDVPAGMNHAVLAATGLGRGWLAYAAVIAVCGIGFGVWLIHLVRPKQGDE